MKQDIKEQIFDKYFVNCEKAELICNDLEIKRSEFSEIAKQIDNERPDELKEMRRIRQLYNNKQGGNFEFSNFNEFYKWYITQFEKQKGCCYYCKTEESVLTKLFEKKYTSAKRPNRGKHLEVERRDSDSNKYNKDNCVLACYFCNNDKSDIFSEDEYFEYLKDRKLFFNKQLQSLK
ncbi:hypothetical protein [Geofilum rhodophaeum]|uniref:hypothetical protein n=1 Tax=Geofilum rhodophaeum TaxID=1965019 RepID=UPI000B520B7E|nr:hypothetical protein [Geofilum rhodophaeum]